MITPIATNIIVEQDPMAAMISTKGASMMEDSLNKLGKVTPKFDNLGP